MLQSIHIGVALALTAVLSPSVHASPAELVKRGQGYDLLVDGKPFPIKGAGGDGDKALLKESGGNAFRTWGIGDDTAARLDEAEELGLQVAVGIWLGHTRHGFSYDDPAQVQQQFDEARAAVLKFKDHPAVLLWGVGNEMEEFGATTDPKVWRAVNDIAAMIHELDPDHPTMTVIAELGADKIPSIKRYCPAVDIVGINSYGGVASMPERFKEAGLDKPYIVTEFGPAGTWEIGMNDWDVPIELTSTEKAAVYQNAYEELAADPNCLGSFVFTWGFKQEATATWYGMFMPDGTKVAAVDAMTEAWSGEPPANLCPVIESLGIAGPASVQPGATVEAELSVKDPEGEPLGVEWVLFEEMDEFNTMGDYRPPPPTLPEAIGNASNDGVTITMPDRPGKFRLFAYVHDGNGGGAVANLPLRVEGEAAAVTSTGPRGQRASLPLVVYGDNMNGSPYTPSGYMGDTAAIQINEQSPTDPHSGQTSLEVAFNKTGGWGGVIWQSPANDWGEQPGGYDLSKAGTLSFWVRGSKGGEVVKFGYGIIGPEQPHPDTAKDERELSLTTEWQQVELPLAGKNLAQIKSGFLFTFGGTSEPMKFYLDDIVYTDGAGGGAGGGEAPTAAAADLPVRLLGDGIGDLPWIPSGYMGDAGAITMSEASLDNPHTGATCTEVGFTNVGGWGGVVWQNPANDWGDQPGGHDLSGAEALTFWARGAQGGEKVKFGLGILGADAAFSDSASADREFILTDDWKEYRIDLTGKNLSRIKTGFYWTLGGQGAPMKFYLDDVAYTGPDEPR